MSLTVFFVGDRRSGMSFEKRSEAAGLESSWNLELVAQQKSLAFPAITKNTNHHIQMSKKSSNKNAKSKMVWVRSTIPWDERGNEREESECMRGARRKSNGREELPIWIPERLLRLRLIQYDTTTMEAEQLELQSQCQSEKGQSHQDGTVGFDLECSAILWGNNV